MIRTEFEQPQDLEIKFLQKICNVQIGVACLVFLLMSCQRSIVDHFCIGGAKPQFLSCSQLILIMVCYVYTTGLFLRHVKYRDTIEYLLHSNEIGCYGDESNQFSEAVTQQYLLSSTTSIKYAVMPVVSQGILLILQTYFVYEIFKAFGNQLKRYDQSNF